MYQRNIVYRKTSSAFLKVRTYMQKVYAYRLLVYFCHSVVFFSQEKILYAGNKNNVIHKVNTVSSEDRANNRQLKIWTACMYKVAFSSMDTRLKYKKAAHQSRAALLPRVVDKQGRQLFDPDTMAEGQFFVDNSEDKEVKMNLRFCDK